MASLEAICNHGSPDKPALELRTDLLLYIPDKIYFQYRK